MAELNDPQEPNENGGTEYDPFSPQHAPGLILIQQLRIYDLLLLILKNTDEAGAEGILKLHQQGKILGPLPTIDLTDDNEE